MPKHHIYVIGGGTINHVRPHLAISAPAYGGTARNIAHGIAALRTRLADQYPDVRDLLGASTAQFLRDSKIVTVLTKMADPLSTVETNADLAVKLSEVVNDPMAKMVFMSAAVADFEGSIIGDDAMQMFTASGKNQDRLRSDREHTMQLFPADKIIGDIRKVRKDIFLVGFKTTAGATVDDQFRAGLKLLKQNSCNLVLANDVHTRVNMVITPEEVPYEITTNRAKALNTLVTMACHRADLTFTRSTIVESPLVPWNSHDVPASLRDVVDHCITEGAYKPFLGKTVGHFAFKTTDGIITSIRKSNFNDLDTTGMVRIEAVGKDQVIAYGARPSVGGQSQRIIFDEHKDVDSIVHFHCPVKPKKADQVPTVSQAPYECGSHECGKNTSDGLQKVNFHGETFKVVYLDGHGPNVVFNKTTNPEAVKDYINETFDLSVSTGQSRLNKYTQDQLSV